MGGTEILNWIADHVEVISWSPVRGEFFIHWFDVNDDGRDTKVSAETSRWGLRAAVEAAMLEPM